jgi:prepilin-type N-terminal cleavage/methylation domain-containing protein
MMLLRRAPSNKKGFSLIEMMIAMVIIMISMLAMLTAIINSMRVNLENDLRNTAIRLTNQTAEALLATSFEDTELSASTAHTRTAGNTEQDKKGFPNPSQTVRNYRQLYTIAWSVVDKTGNVKEVEITVTYRHKEKDYKNVAPIFKHKAI